MEINTTDELKDVLNFYFSRESQNLKVEDKIEIEKCIKESITKIKDSNIVLKTIAEEEIDKRDIDDDFCGKSEKICFIIKKLPNNKKIDVFKYFFDKYHEFTDKSFNKLLLEMLDLLEDEMKEKALAKAYVKILLKLMSEFNAEASIWLISQKRKNYYKKYYEICKNAIELKNAK